MSSAASARGRRAGALVAVLAVLGAAAARAGTSGGRGASRSPAGEPVAAKLEDVRRRPDEWIGQRVRMVLQWDAPHTGWKPYGSRFGPGDFSCFSVWGDEQFLWERESYARTFRRLFARRGSAAEHQLANGTRFGRIEVVVVVREIHLGEAWLEVEAVQPLLESVNEGAILHASHAIEHMEAERWSLAREDLARALASLLPGHARAELERLRDAAVAEEG